VAGNDKLVAISPATKPSGAFLTNSRNTSSRMLEDSDSNNVVAS
jgi:hypothetical protein